MNWLGHQAIGAIGTNLGWMILTLFGAQLDAWTFLITLALSLAVLAYSCARSASEPPPSGEAVDN